MNKVSLVFLWHMHQPYYKDDLSGEYMMPWVFLHGIKDYYELPWLAEKFNIVSTFNLVPSLLEQLEEYSQDLKVDKFLKTLALPIDKLSKEERGFISSRCFDANPENMIAPIARYFELFKKKKSYFSNQELLDVEVLFLLSWCGNYLRENSKIVKTLLLKERDFTEDEKISLLEELRVFLGKIIGYYKKLQQEKKISIFTTPYYHPITPILLDPNSVKEADKTTPVAEISDLSSFAQLHSQMAVEYYQKLFDKKPCGFWPAEGAVSQKALELFSSKGIEYICTDEEILFKSLGNSARENIYKTYYYQTKSGKVFLLFRDKTLSDLIGFTYSNVDAKKASQEFVDRLREISEASGQDVVVPVFLDGENAWEYYPNNAYDFFSNLYSLINKQEWIESVSVEEAFAKVAPQQLERVETGSWIGGNLNTWMGHREKNQGWELLNLVLEDYNGFEDELTDSVKQQIEKEFMVAQGSDWFWWYGDDHYTHLANEFDGLFRKHLQNVYTLAKKEVPKELFRAIKVINQKRDLTQRVPSSFISPTIDGEESSFYEWLGAGKIDLGGGYSVMDSSAVFFNELEYGVDNQCLYLKLKPEDTLRGKEIIVHFVNEKKEMITLDLKKSDEGKCDEYHFVYNRYLEIAIKRDKFDLADNTEIYFVIKTNGKIIQRAPLFNSVELKISSCHDAIWYI